MLSKANFPGIDAAKLSDEFRAELIAIADWWIQYSIDHERGGFYGEVGADNKPVLTASKGIILNARILWFFSETAIEIKDARYRAAAERAYDYLCEYFVDPLYGGVYWELDADGKPLNTKKQVYAQAFTIYALTAYYRLTNDKQALSHAMACFELLESKTIDCRQEGYLEAFSRSWGELDDIRLSEKDLNFPKSQNTHLHVLEAYTTLYQVQPSAQVREALRYNIRMFDKYMIDTETYHLRMFMDENWRDFSPGFTYGHDIEASWLIAKALESLGDAEYTAALMPTLVKIAEATMTEAIGAHGHVIDAFDFASRTQLPDIVWWVQAEALVGFLFAWRESGNEKFLATALGVWEFIKRYQIDRDNGEWFWLSTLDKPQENPYYKVGFWKCPYHNGRAMMEATRYLQNGR
jgi:mannobiose 2-epimerase